MVEKNAKEQLDAILNIKVHHHLWELAYERLFTTLSFAQPSDVICLIGPSRGGKSLLAKRAICEESENAVNSNNTVSVVATNCSTDGRFSTKSFTINALSAVNHPFYAFNSKDLEDTFLKANRLSRTTEPALRAALEAALKHHKTKYLIIDEAHHVLYTNSATTKPKAILDSWKSIAQECALTLVLIGGYDLLTLILKSSHLIGRTSFIHLPRYRANKGELKHFKEILITYEQLLEVETNFLTSNIKYIHQYTLGCTGHLVKWLRRALEESIATKTPLTIKSLETTQRTKHELDVLLQEIQVGELLYIEGTKSIRKQNTNQSNPFQVKPQRFKRASRNNKRK